MNRNLRGHDARSNLPRPLGHTRFGDNGRRRLVTRGFNTEDLHPEVA
jgi:hypothetical protein